MATKEIEVIDKVNTKPATVADSNNLSQLAKEINQTHEAATAAVKKGFEFARQCGRHLLDAKANVKHGEWYPWLATNCPAVSERSAQLYMQVAETWKDAPATTRLRLSDLTLHQAQKEFGLTSTQNKGNRKLKERPDAKTMEPDGGYPWQKKKKSSQAPQPEKIAPRKIGGSPLNILDHALSTHTSSNVAKGEIGALADIIEAWGKRLKQHHPSKHGANKAVETIETLIDELATKLRQFAERKTINTWL